MNNENREIQYMSLNGNKNLKEIEKQQLASKRRKAEINKKNLERRRKLAKAKLYLLLLATTATLGAGFHIGSEHQKAKDEWTTSMEEEQEAKKYQIAIDNAYTKFRKDASNIVNHNMHLVGADPSNLKPQWDESGASDEMQEIIDEKQLTDEDITELIFTIRDEIHRFDDRHDNFSLGSFELTSEMVYEYCGMSLDDYMVLHGLPNDRAKADEVLRATIALKKDAKNALESEQTHGRH